MNPPKPRILLLITVLVVVAGLRAQVPLAPSPGGGAGPVPSQLSNLTRPSGAGGTGTFNKTFNTGVNQKFSKTSPLQDSRFGLKSYERTFSQLMEKRADTWRKLYESGTTSPWSTTGNTYATGEMRSPETNAWTGRKAEFANSGVRKERTVATKFDDAPIFNLMDKKNFAGQASEAMDRTSFNSIRRREYNVNPVEKKADLGVFGGKGGLSGPAPAPQGNGFFDDGASGPGAVKPSSQPVPSTSGDREAPAPANTLR